jgi:hypothetical protein
MAATLAQPACQLLFEALEHADGPPQLMQARMCANGGVRGQGQESTTRIKDVAVCFDRVEEQLHHSQFERFGGTGRRRTDKGQVTVCGRIPHKGHQSLLVRQVQQSELNRPILVPVATWWRCRSGLGRGWQVRREGRGDR